MRPPNQASATSNTATLTLQPGMGKTDPDTVDEGVRVATVTAAVGSRYATVRVQQFCPGVTTDSSTAPGKLVLNPANTTISCNGTTFIGAVVKDSKGQVPPDDTEVTFLAASGSFAAPGSSGASGSSTGSASSSANANEFIAKTSRNGSLNVIYRAGPGTNGQVSITAAAGASFGSTTVTVNCPTGGSAVSGAFASGAVSGSIRPPNTGDGGLVDR